MHGAVQIHPVQIGHTVFRDQNRQVVPLVVEFRHPVEALRRHGPAHRGARHAVIALISLVRVLIFVVLRVIDVEAEEVQRLMNDLQIFLCKKSLQHRGHFSQNHRIQPEGKAHHIFVGEFSGALDFFRRVIRRRVAAAHRRQADDRGLLRILPDHKGALAVCQHVVSQEHRHLLRYLQERRVDTAQIARSDEALRLIDGHPVLHPVRECVNDHLRIVREEIADLLCFPAAHLIDPHGQIPVIERDQRLNACRDQLIDQIAVELNTLRVHDALGRHDARPADGKAIGL